MVFAIPLIAYIAWLKAETARERVVFPLVSLFLTVVLIGGYQFTVAHVFSADDALFKVTNLGDREVGGLIGFLVNIPRKIGRMFWFGGFTFCLGALIVAAAGILSPKFRRSPLVHIFIGYGLVYFALQTIVWYGPARYFLPFIVPLAGLTAIAWVELASWFEANQHYRRYAPLPSLMIAVLVLAGSVHVVTYMATLKYSYRNMADGVSKILRQRGNVVADTIIFGNLADTTAIQAGFRAMNTTLSTVPLEDRLKKYRPHYLLVHVDDKLVFDAVHALGGKMTMLGQWDVLENYYRAGQNVRLMSVDWGPRDTPTSSIR
jgi:hypothetical protein